MLRDCQEYPTAKGPVVSLLDNHHQQREVLNEGTLNPRAEMLLGQNRGTGAGTVQ